MRIRLTRKYANNLNGVDLSRVSVGDVIDLPAREAWMLIHEGWAEGIDVQRAQPVPQTQPDKQVDA